ncbi:MAG: hypothetical protein K9N52_09485 [Verrucomicrobia bacterium]|nr:hypothetical protein [Verrucomicrobiota bacterium]
MLFTLTLNRWTWIVAFLSIAFTATAASNDSLNDLTGHWRLFVDDHYIAAKNNVSRNYHPFNKHSDNPLIVGNKPWEDGDIYLYGTVLPSEDGNGYRMWYQALPGNSDKPAVLYATSEDGIHWEKPELGVYPRNGSKSNNILLADDQGGFMASVIHTPWDLNPSGKYKMFSMRQGGKWIAHRSSDGIHWQDMPGESISSGGSDSAQFLWDPHKKQYVKFGKVIRYVNGTRRRCIGRASTKDLSSWPKLKLVMAPDTYDDRWVEGVGVRRTSLYGVSAFAYESMYIGLLWIFRATGPEGYLIGPLYCEIVTSHDGTHWQRQEKERIPMLPLGPTGSWDDGMVLTATQPLLDGDTLKLYYGGFDEEHSRGMNGKIGLATLRKDGFASLDAGIDKGIVTTKPLSNTKGQLHINYDARDGGLLVEVLDTQGNVIPGYERSNCHKLTENSINQIVTWNDKNSLPTNKNPIRLRLILQNASVYSFMAGENIRVSKRPPKITPAALFTFESQWTQDKLDRDGQQQISFIGKIRPHAEKPNVAFGNRAASIGSPWCQLNYIKINGTRRLGRKFTLALYVKFRDNTHARLFSSYDNCGPIMYKDLVFDCDPNGQTVPGLRLVCKGIEISSNPVSFNDNKYHHIAVTYDDGLVQFFMDGKNIGTRHLPGGEPVVLKRDLCVGEDPTLGREEQLRAYVDDILILGRTLSAPEIRKLHTQGAKRLF